MSDMTPEEIEQVSQTWNLALQMDSEQLGVDAFLMFFEKHPEHRAVFPQIGQVTREMLDSEPEVMQQYRGFAGGAMTRWSEVVSVLGDPEQLEKILHDRAKLYGALRVPAGAFNDFNEVLLDVLAAKVQGFSPETQGAWKKALSYTAKILTSHMD